MIPETVSHTTLVESVRYYAVKLAARYHKRDHSAYDFEDVVQAALLGASEAAQHYDQNHVSGANFLTFAAHPMKNQVLTLIRKSTPVHIPRREYDGMPSRERGKWIWWSYVHLSEPAFKSSEYDDILWESILPDLDTPNAHEFMQEAHRKQQVYEMLSQLPPQDKWLVSVVFGLNGDSEVKVSEVAAIYKVTRQAIHQRLAIVLKRLRRMAISRGLSA